MEVKHRKFVQTIFFDIRGHFEITVFEILGLTVHRKK